MGVFHLVDVFENARIAVPEFHHILDERNNIGGLETTAAGGDFIKELAQGDFVVESRDLFKGEEPSFLDGGLEEEATKALNGLEEALLVKFG